MGLNQALSSAERMPSTIGAYGHHRRAALRRGSCARTDRSWHTRQISLLEHSSRNADQYCILVAKLAAFVEALRSSVRLRSSELVCLILASGSTYLTIKTRASDCMYAPRELILKFLLSLIRHTLVLTCESMA